MTSITLRPLHHRQQKCIGLYYSNDYSINSIVKKIPAVKWSQSNKCWYVPLEPARYNQIVKALEGIGALDNTALKAYLQKRKQVIAVAPVAAEDKAKDRKIIPGSPAWKLSEENLALLEKFIEQLKLNASSNSTITTYRNEFLQLLQLLKKKPVNDLTPNNLKRYMIYAMEKTGIKQQLK